MDASLVKNGELLRGASDGHELTAKVLCARGLAGRVLMDSAQIDMINEGGDKLVDVTLSDVPL